MIPTTIPGALDACRALLADLGDADGLALGSALAAPGGPVAQLVASFDVLRSYVAPSDAILIALAGCAKVISDNGFYGRAGDATDTLIERGAAIAEAVGRSQPPMMVPELPPDLDA